MAQVTQLTRWILQHYRTIYQIQQHGLLILCMHKFSSCVHKLIFKMDSLTNETGNTVAVHLKQNHLC